MNKPLEKSLKELPWESQEELLKQFQERILGLCISQKTYGEIPEIIPSQGLLLWFVQYSFRSVYEVLAGVEEIFLDFQRHSVWFIDFFLKFLRELFMTFLQRFLLRSL